MVFVLVGKRHMQLSRDKSHKWDVVLRGVIKLKLLGVWKIRIIRKKLIIHWIKKKFLLLVTRIEVVKPKSNFWSGLKYYVGFSIRQVFFYVTVG
jgi:hypothetical protein